MSISVKNLATSKDYSGITAEYADKILRLWSLSKVDPMRFKHEMKMESACSSGVTSPDRVFTLTDTKTFGAKRSRVHVVGKKRRHEKCLDGFFHTASGVATANTKNSSIPNLNYVSGHDVLKKRVDAIDKHMEKWNKKNRISVICRYVKFNCSLRDVCTCFDLDLKHLSRLCIRARKLCGETISGKSVH